MRGKCNRKIEDYTSYRCRRDGGGKSVGYLFYIMKFMRIYRVTVSSIECKGGLSKVLPVIFKHI